MSEVVFEGDNAYEEFAFWTDEVNLQPFEIRKIVVDYRKIKKVD